MNAASCDLSRRYFIQKVAAGGLVLAVIGPGCQRREDALRGSTSGKGDVSFSPAAYVRVDDAGIVTVICHRSEMGQGVRTSVAMAVADELDADWSQVRVEQAIGDEKIYGSQNTDGSRSLRDFLQPLREAGAAARSMLVAAAAQQWNVPAAELQTQGHSVVHGPSGRKASYGELVPVARELQVPEARSLRLKEPAQFRYIGKEIPIVDLMDMTTGRAQFGIDLRRDGMLAAVVARPPVYGSSVASFDATAAEKVPGVVRVVQISTTPPPSGFMPLGGVAVVARNTWAAMQARRQLTIKWNDSPNAKYDSARYRAQLEKNARRAGKVARNQGDVDAALRSAAKRVTADYYIPHLAHAQMEPLSALAVVENNRCEVWAPTQHPQGTRDTLAAALGIPVENVRVNVTLLGGGFGRKSKPDFIVEAALLAREMAAPVKVIWTREDDTQHDYYHTVAVQHVEAGLDKQGKVTAWLHRSALPSIQATFAPDIVYQGDSELGQGLTDFPYAVPNYRAEAVEAPAHVRIGWYRSVINIPHAFAIASFVDELAHAAGRDPRDFVLEMLGPPRIIDMSKAGITGKPWNYDKTFEEYPVDVGRLRHVVEVATKEAGWGSKLPAGSGRGLAVHRSFVSYVATVMHVEVGRDGSLRIPRVDVAIDPGFVVHPERIRAQMEGSTIMGLGNALYGEITFREGRAVQSNFTDYRVMRMDAAPREIHVHIVPSGGPPGGVGEPGVPPTAPALCNAIFAATGKRIRSLPIGEQLASRGAT